MSNIVKPEGWVVLKMTDTFADACPPIYKVFASFRGGYLDGDSWKLNSGIKSVNETENEYIFYGYSGSEYHCIKNYYGHCSNYAESVLASIIERADKHGYSIIQLPHDYDFKSIEHE